jgi:hypothetical protein
MPAAKHGDILDGGFGHGRQGAHMRHFEVKGSWIVADYGLEMKHYAVPANFGPFQTRRENPPRLDWIKHEAKIGKPHFAKMSVNHIERANLSVRLFDRRFTRKTLGYSKCLRDHRLAVALQIAHWNFCPVHSAHNQTPAMAACLTDHIWRVAELLAAFGLTAIGLAAWRLHNI